MGRCELCVEGRVPRLAVGLDVETREKGNCQPRFWLEQLGAQETLGNGIGSEG